MMELPEELLTFIKALASESRIRILLLFMDGEERTVNVIAETVGLGQSTTSEHLAAMRRAGLLVSRKENREVYYRPDREKIIAHLDTLNTILKQCCSI